MSICSKSASSILAALILPTCALADHVVGYQFEEGSGTTTADTEATVLGDQFGTLQGGASFTAGNLSANTPGAFALELDGVDDSVLIDSAGNLLQGISGATFSAWINIDSLPAAGSFDSVIFVSNPTATGNSARLALQIGGNGVLALGGRRGDVDNFSRYASANGVLSLNTTHHIAGTVDFSSGAAEVHLYVDGSEVSIATAGSFSAGTAFQNTASAAARIGAQGGGAAEFVDGTIDDVKIWQRPLTSAQIAAQAVPEPASAGLLGMAAVGLLGLRRRKA